MQQAFPFAGSHLAMGDSKPQQGLVCSMTVATNSQEGICQAGAHCSESTSATVTSRVQILPGRKMHMHRMQQIRDAEADNRGAAPLSGVTLQMARRSSYRPV